MKTIGARCVEADQICDYIPVVSTVSNLVDLVQKGVRVALPKTKTQGRYWTHIKEKSCCRCITLIVFPLLGNIEYLVKDVRDYRSAIKEKARDIETKKKVKQAIEMKQAARRAAMASALSGLQVSPEEMMPAETPDEQALYEGCSTDSLSKVRVLLDKGISPNFYHTGLLPLVTACKKSSEEMVRLLLDYQADPHLLTKYGKSAMMSACSRGDIKIVRLLQSVLEDTNEADSTGYTPLMAAALKGHETVIAFLLEQGADPYEARSDGTNAVISALCQDQVHVLPMLLGENTNVDAHKFYNEISGHINIQYFMHRVEKLTPLLYATRLGAIRCALYLLPKSNIRACDSEGGTVLHYVGEKTELLHVYLETCNAPEFVDAKDKTGSTALHQAIKGGFQNSAMLLLENQANPFIMNQEGKTPLILACQKGYIEILKYIDKHYHEDIPPQLTEKIHFTIETGLACAAQNSPQGNTFLSNRVDTKRASSDEFIF